MVKSAPHQQSAEAMANIALDSLFKAAGLKSEYNNLTNTWEVYFDKRYSEKFARLEALSLHLKLGGSRIEERLAFCFEDEKHSFDRTSSDLEKVKAELARLALQQHQERNAVHIEDTLRLLRVEIDTRAQNLKTILDNNGLTRPANALDAATRKHLDGLRALSKTR